MTGYVFDIYSSEAIDAARQLYLLPKHIQELVALYCAAFGFICTREAVARLSLLTDFTFSPRTVFLALRGDLP